MEGIFNPMLPFALIWAAFDSLFIIAAKGDSFVMLFMLFHLVPVWIYLGGLLMIMRKYKHTEYIVTDKGVYISGGVFSYSCQMKPFTELARVNIHRGIIDQFLDIGDVIMTSNNVADFYSQLQEDIYTDTMYPNDLRPEENHGYKTHYKGM